VSRRGLPATIRLRHDSHFVEELTARHGTPIGRLISIQEIEPNPNQPRQQMGDLSELAASIREKGILEPLIVRRLDDRYQIISGERRYQAAVQAGLVELPCVERDADDRETVEIALIENLQRKDLTPFEEAEALAHLADEHGYTHELLAKKIGKARTSITESLSLNSMPEEIKNICRLADIWSKSLLLQILRQDTPEKMVTLIERISQDGLRRDEARTVLKKRGAGRPKNYVFKYAPKGSSFRFQLTFRKSSANKHEIIEALRQILANLEA